MLRATGKTASGKEVGDSESRGRKALPPNIGGGRMKNRGGVCSLSRRGVEKSSGKRVETKTDGQLWQGGA